MQTINPSTIRRNALGRVLARLIFALALLLPAIVGTHVFTPATAMAQSETILELRERHDTLEVQVQGLKSKRTKLAEKQRTLTQKIAQKKRSGASTKILAGLSLEKLLEDNQIVVEKLNATQAELNRASAELEETRHKISAAYAAKIKRVEASALQSNGEELLALVQELNRLKRAQYNYRPKHNASPSTFKSVSPVVTSDDPDELLASAAELEDQARRMEDSIAGVSSDLERLQKRRRALRRASAFSEEEALFEEESTAGRRVRVEVRRESQGDNPNVVSGGGGAEQDAEEPPSNAAGDPGESPAEPTTDASGAPDDGDRDVPVGEFDGLGSDAGGGGVGVGGGFDVPAGRGTDAPPSILVRRIDTQGDEGVRLDQNTGRDLNSRIKALKRQKKDIKREAQSLRLKAKSLRKRASEL